MRHLLKGAMAMPETKTQRSAARTAASATPRRGATRAATKSAAHKPRAKPKAATHKPRAAVDRTTGLSKEVLESLESGQRAAIEAVRKFMDSVDESLPPHGEGSSKRQEIVDSAMELADRLVHTQYDFLRKIVHSAGKSLNRSDSEK
jgi:hypothetical protein